MPLQLILMNQWKVFSFVYNISLLQLRYLCNNLRRHFNTLRFISETHHRIRMQFINQYFFSVHNLYINLSFVVAGTSLWKQILVNKVAVLRGLIYVSDKCWKQISLRQKRHYEDIKTKVSWECLSECKQLNLSYGYDNLFCMDTET